MLRSRHVLAAALACSILVPAASFAGAPTPRKVIALLDSTQNFGNTRRAVNFYDVTAIGAGTADPNHFLQTPMFSIWTGYDDSVTLNFEDPDAITVNPINGDVYLAAFDSGTPGTYDPFQDDTDGDYDLYRLDYQKALDDFLTNSRPMGTMYAPVLAPDAGVQAAGVNKDHPDHIGTTIHLSSVSQKIGELARTQGGPFFDYDIEFIDPQTLAFLDNQNGNDGVNDLANYDHELRIWERVSTDPNAAVSATQTNADPNNPATGSWEGGYKNGTTEVWRSDRAALINQDFDPNTGLPSGRSEPVDITAVQRDGVTGVWVLESDGGGDDVAFFELSGISTPAGDATATASLIELTGTSRALDNDPELVPNENLGQGDWVIVDEDGNLLIGESGFFDAPQHDPTVLRLNVDQYQPGNVETAGANPGGDFWDDLDSTYGLGDDSSDDPNDFSDVPPTPLDQLNGTFNDDDAGPTDGRFTTYDPGENMLYIFDADSGSVPGVVGDVYVVDLDTGTIVHSELDAANHFFERNGVRLFNRGDTNGDGLVDQDDIDAFADVAITQDTLMEEMYDLTSDMALDFGYDNDPNSVNDSDELINGILGTEYGDANLDGMVDSADLASLQGGYGSAGGWLEGDYNGDGVVNFLDLSILGNNFGFTNMPLVLSAATAAVPEPASLMLLGLGGLVAMRRRR